MNHEILGMFAVVWRGFEKFQEECSQETHRKLVETANNMAPYLEWWKNYGEMEGSAGKATGEAFAKLCKGHKDIQETIGLFDGYVETIKMLVKECSFEDLTQPHIQKTFEMEFDAIMALIMEVL